MTTTSGGVSVTVGNVWEQVGSTACGTVYVTDEETKLPEVEYRALVRQRMQNLWDSAMEVRRLAQMKG